MERKDWWCHFGKFQTKLMLQGAWERHTWAMLSTDHHHHRLRRRQQFKPKLLFFTNNLGPSIHHLSCARLLTWLPTTQRSLSDHLGCWVGDQQLGERHRERENQGTLILRPLSLNLLNVGRKWGPLGCILLVSSAILQALVVDEIFLCPFVCGVLSRLP